MFCPLMGVSPALQCGLISLQRAGLESPTRTFLKLPAAATWHVLNCSFPHPVWSLPIPEFRSELCYFCLLSGSLGVCTEL